MGSLGGTSVRGLRMDKDEATIRCCDSRYEYALYQWLEPGGPDLAGALGQRFAAGVTEFPCGLIRV